MYRFPFDEDLTDENHFVNVYVQFSVDEDQIKTNSSVYILISLDEEQMETNF